MLAGAPAGTLVTAAPDAYGFLLPERPIRRLRVGAEGLFSSTALRARMRPA